MTFVHPARLFALILGLIPIIIYYLMRFRLIICLIDVDVSVLRVPEGLSQRALEVPRDEQHRRSRSRGPRGAARPRRTHTPCLAAGRPACGQLGGLVRSGAHARSAAVAVHAAHASVVCVAPTPRRLGRTACTV